MYLGRQGDHHTEWFPGARPEQKRIEDKKADTELLENLGSP